MTHTALSVVIPVYNEQETLLDLSKRLMPVLEKLKGKSEVIYINDGSKDSSLKILKDLHSQHPHVVRVIDLEGNYGQHMAIMAGFEHARGDVIVNLDADLQNPPEEIPKLMKKIEEGHDYVGSYRIERQDAKWRHYGSRFANHVRSFITPVQMKDQGCMFRAYARSVVNKVIQGRESSVFIPAMGQMFAKNPTEIGLYHDAREAGDSKYGLYELIRVSIDLATSLSLVPIQTVTFTGIITSLVSFLTFIYLMLRRLVVGPEAEGMFTLHALLFFLIGVAILGIGIIGEYVGRSYKLLTGRPRYVVRELIESNTSEKGAAR